MDPFVRAFLVSRQADGVTASTLEWHQYSLQSFTKWLDDDHRDPELWTPTLLREYVVHLQGSGFAPSTVTNKVQSLLAFTRWLHEEGFTETNAGARIKKPKAPFIQKQPYTTSELKALLHASRTSPRDHAITTLLIDTGIRANELCMLRSTDVILGQSLLSVHGKGGKDRIVPLSVKSAKVLAKWMSKHRADFVFPSEQSEHLTPNSLYKLVQRIGARAGVTHVYCHRFRHTFALHYLRNGGDPLSLQRLLGHMSLTMTVRYVAMSTDDLVEQHAKASPLMNL
jgi:site-specific recombinase XerD